MNQSKSPRQKCGVPLESGLSNNNTHRRNQLVILDMNGLLCMKVPNDSNYKLSNPSIKIIKIKNYVLYIRPGIHGFMDRLLKNYKVAIFSSTTRKNLILSLGAILGNRTMKRINFIWDRSRARHDPDYGKNPLIKSHQTVKILKDVWDNPIVNPWRIWNQTNTICIDNEITKLRFNKPDNIIISPEWDPNSFENKLPELEKTIVRKFDLLIS